MPKKNKEHQNILSLIEKTKTAIKDCINVNASKIEDELLENVEGYHRQTVKIVDRLNNLESCAIGSRCPKHIVEERENKLESVLKTSRNCLRLLDLLEKGQNKVNLLEEQLNSQQKELSTSFSEWRNLIDATKSVDSKNKAKSPLNNLQDLLTTIGHYTDSSKRNSCADSLLTERQCSLDYSPDVSLSHNSCDDLRTAIELE